MSYQQFLSACSIWWKSEGSTNVSNAKEAGHYLLRAPKKVGEPLISVAAKAWALYKKANQKK